MKLITEATLSKDKATNNVNMITNMKVAFVGFIIKKTSRNKDFSIARSLIYYYCKIPKMYTAPGFV